MTCPAGLAMGPGAFGVGLGTFKGLGMLSLGWLSSFGGGTKLCMSGLPTGVGEGKSALSDTGESGRHLRQPRTVLWTEIDSYVVERKVDVVGDANIGCDVGGAARGGV